MLLCGRAAEVQGNLATLSEAATGSRSSRMDHNEYIKLADVEDRMWHFRSLHAHAQRLLAAGVAGKERPQILDAGCGTGGFIARMQRAQPDWRFSGIDFSPFACEFATKRCAGADIREASITALPFAEASFDAVVSLDVVCQVQDNGKAFGEFFRCTRPGGAVVVNLPAYRWMWSYHDETCQTKHRYGRRELAGLLTAAGFRDVRVTHWNMLPFPLLVLKRKVFRTASATSDVRLFPAPIEACFNAAMAVEHAWMKHVSGLPFGSSVLAFGRRPV
jgi:ubiquinone/menaquinone biosynthesis C-methylase UbiE